MSKTIRLTPISRVFLTLAIVGGIFFLLKSFVLPKKDSAGNTTFSGKKSNGLLLFSLSGSSTLGANMIPQIAKEFMSSELNAQNVSIEKVSDNETNVIGSIDGTEKRINIITTGSGQGVIDLRNQSADLAMISGGADDLASDVKLSNIALDGIAIMVNKVNSVKELTKNQVRDIFLGKITNWSQVGGQPGVMNVYTRSTQSGTFEAFKQLILEQTTAALSINVKVIDDSKKLVMAIENDPFGIGFSSFSSIGATNALGLSDVGTLVQYPSVFSVQTEDYLLTRRLYLGSSWTKGNPLAQRFIDFCIADDKGQKVIAEAGFVNMNLHNADTHSTFTNAPPQYLTATDGAKRLPTTLHFKSGSKLPDTRATDDIKRIVSILSEPESRQKSVKLIGFTDNIGNPTQNLSLSTQRAQSIQAELAKFGVKSEVFGFGQALPIATNATVVGQNKNRRVEVWIK